MSLAAARKQFPHLNDYTDQELLGIVAKSNNIAPDSEQYRRLERDLLGYDRTASAAVKDTGVGLAQGVMGLGKIAGVIGGAVLPGVSAFNNSVVGAFDEWSKDLDQFKSQGLRNREAGAAVNADIATRTAAAEGAGEWGQLAAGAKAQAGNYVSNPSLAVQDLVANAPQLVAGGLIGRGIQVGAKALGLGAQAATRAGVVGGIGSGGVMQGSDVGADTYARLRAAGASHEQATSLATDAATVAGGASIALSAIPGASTVERSLLQGATTPLRFGLGRAGTVARVGATEAVTEGLDEGLGRFAGNESVREVDPTVSRVDGVGQAFVQGGVVGGPMGAYAGLRTTRAAPNQPRTETGEIDLTTAPPSAGGPSELDVPTWQRRGLRLDDPNRPGNAIEYTPVAVPAAPVAAPAPATYHNGIDYTAPASDPAAPSNLALGDYQAPVYGNEIEFEPSAPAAPAAGLSDYSQPLPAHRAPEKRPYQGGEVPLIGQPQQPSGLPRSTILEATPGVMPMGPAGINATAEDLIRNRESGQNIANAPAPELILPPGVERPSSRRAPEAPAEAPAVQAEATVEAPAAPNRGQLLIALQAASTELGRTSTRKDGELSNTRGNAPLAQVLEAADPLAAMRELHQDGTNPRDELLDLWHKNVTGKTVFEWKSEQAPADLNSAGFVPEPPAQVAAQVEAVRDGRKDVAVMGEQEAITAELNGLASGVATGPDGAKAVVVSQDPAKVDAAVQRAAEIGLKPAMGEALGVANPTITSQPEAPAAVAAVQQVDNKTGEIIAEELVTPADLPNVKPVADTTPRIVPMQQPVADRRAAMPAATQAAVEAKPAAAPVAPQPAPAPQAAVEAKSVVEKQHKFGRKSSQELIEIAETTKDEGEYVQARYEMYRRWAEDTDEGVSEAYLTDKENKSALTKSEVKAFELRYRAELKGRGVKRGQALGKKFGAEVETVANEMVEEAAASTAEPEAETVFEEEAPPAKPAPDVWKAPTAPVPRSAPDWATNHAADIGGEVVFWDNDVALIAGHSVLTGATVYAAVNRTSGSRTRVDIAAYKGNGFTEAQMETLRTERARLAAEQEALQAANPDGPFAEGQRVAASDSVPKAQVSFLEGLLQTLNMGGVRVFLMHPNDVRGNRAKYKLFGQFASAASAGLDANEDGSVRRFGSSATDFYIGLRPGMSDARAIETIAHELGHIIERVMLKSAPASVQTEIRKAYEAWLIQTKQMTAPQIIDALRNRETAAAHVAGVSDTARLSSYWTSFSEWFADNTSRWVTTADKPMRLMDKFFAAVANQMRKLAAAVKGVKYVPNPAVAKFLESMAASGLRPDLAAEINALGGTDSQSSRAPSSDDGAPTEPGVLKSFSAAAKSVIAGIKAKTSGAEISESLLSMMSLRQIDEQFGKKLPALRDWIGAIFARSTNASKLAAEADRVALQWEQSVKDPAERRTLADILLRASVAELELDNTTDEYLAELSPEERAEHTALRQKLTALSPEARKTREQALAILRRQWEYTRSALESFINHTVADPGLRNQRIEDLKAEMGRNRGDYFPLSRFGNRIVVGRSAAKDGRDTVSFHETAASAEAEVARLKAAGVKKIDVTLQTERDPRQRATTGFVGSLHQMIDNSDADGSVKDSMHEALQQLYLKSLPELSGAKHMIRREAVEGFSQDALRAFADAVTRGARYASHLEYAPVVQAAMESAESQSRSSDKRTASVVIGRKDGEQARVMVVPTGTDRLNAVNRMRDEGYEVEFFNTVPELAKERLAGALEGATQAQIDGYAAQVESTVGRSVEGVEDMRAAKALYNHMVKLQKTEADQDPSAVVEALGQVGYTWFLGFSPAFWAMNTLQNPMVGIPHLGAKYGVTKAAGAWFDAAKWFGGVRMGKLMRDGKTPFSVEWLKDAVKSGQLTGISKQELDMLQALEDRQVLDFTQAMDLSRIGQASSDKRYKFMRLAAAGAHHTEVFNRVTFALAAYRLALKSGGNVTHQEAVRRAENDTAAVHFDYSYANKPEMMRGKTRLVFMFQQYRQHMLYWWAKNVKDMVKNEAPGDRIRALKAAMFMGTTQCFFAGALGMPFVGAVAFLANALGADDEDGVPFDFNTWITDAAVDFTGSQKIGGGLAKGIFAAIGMNIGQRIGQADLLPFLNEGSAKFERNADDKVRAYLFDLLGPLGSIALGAARSTEAFERGDTAAGLAATTPKAVSDIIKAYQLETEGMKDKKGQFLATAEAFDGADVFMQAAGVAPTSVAKIRADRSRVRDVESKLQERSRRITGQFVEAWMRGDREGVMEAVEAVKEYNRQIGPKFKNPGMLIDGRQLEMAIKDRYQKALLLALTGGTAETKRQLMIATQLQGLNAPVTQQSMRENAAGGLPGLPGLPGVD